MKSHHPSVPDSNLPYMTLILHNYSLFQPYVSQMAPGSSDQLGASEPWALWVICQREMAQDLFLRGWKRALDEYNNGRSRKELDLV